jgi:DNA-directed RNA polymerase specialized sigma24 family protein
MSEAVREVFLLNRIEKMTYAQIADSLGLSVKAIEKRMQKALEIFSDLKKSIID